MRAFLRLSAVVALALPLVAMAQMSSTGYTVPSDAFSGGGAYGSSTNFHAIDTAAEMATPAESAMSSTNYKACAGFQCIGVGKSLTAVITTAIGACAVDSAQVDPMSQNLGTLTTAGVSTAPERICVIVSDSEIESVVVTVQSANSGLASSSVPGDVIASASASLTAGTAGFGICASNVMNGFVANAPFNGTCDNGSGHDVGAISTSSSVVFHASGQVANALGEILTKASIAATTPGHGDYGDSLTVIVTGTF